jgi:hypothetical protein
VFPTEQAHQSEKMLPFCLWKIVSNADRYAVNGQNRIREGNQKKKKDGNPYIVNAFGQEVIVE